MDVACRRAGLLLVLLALSSPFARASAAARIELDLWCDLDPIVQEGAGKDVLPIDAEEAVHRMLAEARVILSGMIYGYTFSYTPSDESRRVPESFDLVPRAEIPWGDPSLHVASTRMEGRRLHALLRYELSTDQEERREAWRSGGIAKSSGKGMGNVFGGVGERSTALTEAVKESIRSHLRPRVHNKPREVRGEILLWDVPGTYVDSGQYHTRVITRLRVAELTPYRVF